MSGCGENVHVTKWKLVSPQTLVVTRNCHRCHHLLPERQLQANTLGWMQPYRPGGEDGDAEMLELARRAMPLKGVGRRRDAGQRTSVSRRSKRPESVVKKFKRRRQAEAAKKKRKSTDEVQAQRKRKNQRIDEDSGSLSDSSSESEPVVRSASTRPGCLLKSALKEMSRYLSARRASPGKCAGQIRDGSERRRRNGRGKGLRAVLLKLVFTWQGWFNVALE